MRGTMMAYPLTLQHVFDHGTTLFPKQEIVTGSVSGAHRYTYREFGERVRRLAGALRSLGIRRGDRVASFAWNHSRHLELYFAVPLIGAVLHTVNIRLFPEDVAYIINHAGDRLIFADRSLLPTLRGLRGGLATVERVVSMDDGSDVDTSDAADYEDLLARGGDDRPFIASGEDDAAMLCYTAGTTGRPKGVLYSHRALVLHAFGACMVDSLALSHRDATMAIVPMFHVTAWGVPFACTLVGAKQVFPGVAPQPERYLALLQDERITFAAGVPTVWIALRPMIASGRYDLSSLQRVFIGGSAVPPGLIRAYDELGITIYHAWGMTETTPIGTVGRLKQDLDALEGDERVARRAKQGLPVPGVELRAVDAEGAEVPQDGRAMGDLLARGPWIAGSYFDNPEGAASWTDDGWFRTGDVVTIDEDGYVEIVDRTKDLIKSGGEWISSVALENALMAHPNVHEAAVIAMPDPTWIERPMASVVPRPEARKNVGDAELAEHLRPLFAKWWLPDRYVFLDEIPKTSVGKFDKKALRARLQDGSLDRAGSSAP